MTKEILVTGGAGFIGTNFIDYLLKHTNYRITNIDKLTYAANEQKIKDFEGNSNYRFIQGDISSAWDLQQVFDRNYDGMIHFAAESHVDRSILNATPFIDTNINGTHQLLEALRVGKAKRMVHISTDEVYGSLSPSESAFKETTPLSPNNPYAASKASADLLVHSYYQTHKLDVIITRCSNNYGPYQHPEKLIPKVISNALTEQEIPIYGDGKQIRDWLFVTDHCRAVLEVFEKGRSGEVYNIGGSNEKTNREVVEFILNYLGKDTQLITYVEDRKAHDRRYAINWEKIRQQLGWKPVIDFSTGLTKTIEWYCEKVMKTGDKG